jgi:outer membrane murein-binding lipoprotein Lpp
MVISSCNLLTTAVRKQELKKSVETYESQVNDLRKQVQVAEEASASAKAQIEATQKELERALPFEDQVKEKNLLIGKLRHEAVTLNEHLAKALRRLKKGRPEENVDRQIITNYILHFLSIDRSDPKKFEALQLISSLLGWTDGTSYLSHSHHPIHYALHNITL